jgi:hypothetical protein
MLFSPLALPDIAVKLKKNGKGTDAIPGGTLLARARHD